ncbi:hypothetical protein HKD37_16G044535 [Glycine soja]
MAQTLKFKHSSHTKRMTRIKMNPANPFKEVMRFTSTRCLCSGMYGLPKLQVFWISEHTNEKSFFKMDGGFSNDHISYKLLMKPVMQKEITSDPCDHCHEAFAA